MNHFKRIIIGASCWSAGEILRGAADTLVVDRSASVGREYFENYRKCGPGGMLNTEIARQLQRELELRGKSGDMLALAPLLYAKLHDLTGRFRLWTEMIDIQRNSAGWRLEIYDVGGQSVLHADELIDCTPECMSNPDFRARNVERYFLNAIVLIPEFGGWENSGFQFRPGRRDGEFFMSLEMALGTDWTEARKLLLEHWQARPDTWKDARICAIARNFDYQVKCDSARLDEHYYYFNSARFANPLAALDYTEDVTC